LLLRSFAKQLLAAPVTIGAKPWDEPPPAIAIAAEIS
jgi:hypothetical protein